MSTSVWMRGRPPDATAPRRGIAGAGPSCATSREKLMGVVASETFPRQALWRRAAPPSCRLPSPSRGPSGLGRGPR
jgi:hypothetical protein